MLALGGCVAMETGEGMNTKGVLAAAEFPFRPAGTPEPLVDRRGAYQARHKGESESDGYGDRCPVSDKI